MPQDSTACEEAKHLLASLPKTPQLAPEGWDERPANVRKTPPVDYVAKDGCEDLSKTSRALVIQGSFLEEQLICHLCGPLGSYSYDGSHPVRKYVLDLSDQ